MKQMTAMIRQEKGIRIPLLLFSIHTAHEVVKCHLKADWICCECVL